MNTQDFEDDGSRNDEKPIQMAPIMQEKKLGNNLLGVGEDYYVEVSGFKGKTYVGLRQWFRAEDNCWYRTKRGINLQVSAFLKLVGKMPEIAEFVKKEAQGVTHEQDSGY